MQNIEFPTTASALSRWIGAAVLGDGEAPIDRLAPLSAAGSGSLSFFAHRKYADALEKARGGVILTSEALARPELPVTYLLVEDPQRAFADLARRFATRLPWTGISPQAVVAPTATIAEGAAIGPFAVIGDGVRIGARTQVGAYVYLGKDVSLGDDCEVHPHVTVLDRVVVGNRVKIFASSVIGSDGFGLFDAGGACGHAEMPQIGTVIIGDDVRVGAHCTIDRSTLGATRVGTGTKLDDHVHVGHNVQIGRNCILCGAVAIGGSAVIEDDVILAGQSGVGHGVHIGKGARLGGQAGTTTNLKGGETYALFPATPIRDVTRILRYWKRLPEIWKRLRRVEKTLGISEPEGEA